MMPMFDEGGRWDKPRHLLGIAGEESIRNAVARGIDTLDSCYPTRVARHGTLLTRQGVFKIKSGKNKDAFGVKIDDECNCTTYQRYHIAYLWNLFKANESIAPTLAITHNLQYMHDKMKGIREDIMAENPYSSGEMELG